MTIEDELSEITASLDTKQIVKVKSKSAIDELKETLDSLRTVNPALVDSSRIFEHILKDVDMAFVVNETNVKINDLCEMIATLLSENNKLQQEYNVFQQRFSGLEAALKQRDDLDFQFKQRAASALSGIEQYLRSHT